ncbi:GNAT family N-acetyltransferase [Vaginisenegalia massiliensis]|uniref:GNAT family N-acetyltransferase n=1 Tax=Vaginisenegalia massiliensis TaxID=2058294 RepID=UPI0013DE4C1B|nr:GNAT family N-acetyltransferase [Vaginisenegalia massiliensis]
MEIISYFESSNPSVWLKQLANLEWPPSRHLSQMIGEGEFYHRLGQTSQLFLLVEDQYLIGHCTLSEQDNISDLSRQPWIGYVYVHPDYRGQKLFMHLLAYAESWARQKSYNQVYISSSHQGLYEQYDYQVIDQCLDNKGRPTQVFCKSLD